MARLEYVMCVDCVYQLLNVNTITNLKKAMHYICGVKKIMVGSIFGQDRPSSLPNSPYLKNEIEIAACV
jgi:hypothetical protein